ncbi:hypothetical protein SO802_008824 [Lithocarpus litseifolius]|uniref:RNase H type-1 domain-containing protein n=1 Tax=Lithocarpus litseifolius TaxID=425828 RepID=A0AAW2DBV7_9ROSI
MAVLELINLEIHVWRTELIHSIFHPNDAKAICRIQLSRRHVADSIIWSYNKNGYFSVKSAYKVARKIQGEDRAKSSTSNAGKKVWQALWNLNIPNKVKVLKFFLQELICVGAIIRNEQGQVMAAMTTSRPKMSSSEEAKLLACRRSMEFAVDVGFTKLIIEGDNVNVMQAISSSRINCSLLGYVVDEIRHLVHCLEWARISFTRRGGNKVAHALAQQVRNSLDNDVYWMEDSPPPAAETLI